MTGESRWTFPPITNDADASVVPDVLPAEQSNDTDDYAAAADLSRVNHLADLVMAVTAAS